MEISTFPVNVGAPGANMQGHCQQRANSLPTLPPAVVLAPVLISYQQPFLEKGNHITQNLFVLPSSELK